MRSEGKSPVLSVRVTPEERAALETIATKHKCASVSVYVRRLIGEAIKRNGIERKGQTIYGRRTRRTVLDTRYELRRV